MKKYLFFLSASILHGQLWSTGDSDKICIVRRRDLNRQERHRVKVVRNPLSYSNKNPSELYNELQQGIPLDFWNNCTLIWMLEAWLNANSRNLFENRATIAATMVHAREQGALLNGVYKEKKRTKSLVDIMFNISFFSAKEGIKKEINDLWKKIEQRPNPAIITYSPLDAKSFMQKLFNIMIADSHNTKAVQTVGRHLALLREYKFLPAESMREIFIKILEEYGKISSERKSLEEPKQVEVSPKKEERRRKSIHQAEHSQNVWLHNKAETAEIIRPSREWLTRVLKRGSFCDVILQREGDEGT